jgi:quercetin dioxygenase-like cupin family protein
MPIIRNGSNPAVKGPASTFTGSVRIETPFAAVAPGRVAGAIVTFEPGARSAWHTHPLGQVLIITSGLGWTQQENGRVEVMHPGDVSDNTCRTI